MGSQYSVQGDVRDIGRDRDTQVVADWGEVPVDAKAAHDDGPVQGSVSDQ